MPKAKKESAKVSTAKAATKVAPSQTQPKSKHVEEVVALEENVRGPGVTPTPEVMAAERSPRAASMSTTQPLIKTGSHAFEIFMRCGSKNFKHGLENHPENSPGYYRTNAHGSPTKNLVEKRGILANALVSRTAYGSSVIAGLSALT